jgi:outer membrane protein OmpA-like peptidoglycan-associated protein
MSRVLLLASLTVVAITFVPATARAEPVEVGALLGPRLYAEDSVLGDTAFDDSLRNGLLFGVRLARPIIPWLVPELELVASPATTRDLEISVFWFEPRAHLRMQLRPDTRLRPFVVLGGGMPVALSSKRGGYDSGLIGEGYVGGGLGWNPGRGLSLRLDARVSLLQGRGEEKPVTVEGELTAGVWFPLGKRTKKAPATEKVRPKFAPVIDEDELPSPDDKDGDGYTDALDKCPDRAEDHDGFDDKDGCPDIDNDGDQVLDVADKCASVAESYNGFEDDDGCPDTVDPEVDSVIGTIEGLLYAPGETDVRATANEGLDRIVKVLQAHPSVRLVLVGHTDAKEALAAAKPDPAAPPPEGDPADPAELARELGKNRATAVRNALVKRGLTKGRFVIDSAGNEMPVSDEDTNRGRLRNRRVEVRLFVPKR